MKNKFLVFLDIDGTLIKENQKPNTNKLPSVIKKLEKEGFLFGLNSNRSLEDIENIYKKFALNGPVILENGIYFKKNIKGKKKFIFDKKNKINNDILRATKKFIKEKKLNATVSKLDTVSEISKNKNIKGISIMINKFRLYTGSIHIYRDGTRDRILAKKLAIYLKKYFKDLKKDISVMVTSIFGNIILFPKGINKKLAFKAIRKYYSDYNFVMIGDDIDDANTIKYVDYFFTVGNASNRVKSKASYVSKNFYTRGVVDILNNSNKILK